MAFVVLIVALIPLSYLFTTSLIQAGQATNQQTALSIAEKWTEVLSNTTPPVNPSTGAVITDVASAPQGPAPTSAATTVASGSNNQNLATASTIDVASVANFAPASTTTPQYAQVTTGSGASAVTSTVTYTGLTTSPAALTGCSCGTGSGTMTTGSAVSQDVVVTPTEIRGNTTYTLLAKYSWETAQNSGASTQDLCSSGTPQLLKLTVSVSWGPNADGNQIDDSVMLNYPPSGVQTLGFIALQMSGDQTAYDAQYPSHPWSTRVQSIPVTITPLSGGSNTTLHLYPDSYGCVFAQVPQGTYSVTAADPVSGYPSGTTYGSPLFVANATGTVNALTHVWGQPTSLPTGTAPTVSVSIGAVTRVASQYSSQYPGFDQGSNLNLTYPSSTAVEDGVTCPGVNQITCVATGQVSGGTAAINWANGASWNSASAPTGVTRVASVACAGTTACVGVGYGPSGSVILHSSTSSGLNLSSDTVPAAALGAGASLNTVACPSASQCVAVGTSSTGSGIVLTGTIGTTTDSWTQDTLAGTTSLSGLVCPTASGCAAIGTTASGGPPVVATGPTGAGAWAVGTATGFTITGLTQLACPSTTSCVAIGTGQVGSGAAGPIVITGTVTGGTGLGTTGSTVAWTADALTSTTLTSLSQVVCPLPTKCLITGSGTSGTHTGALILYGGLGGPLSAEFPLDNGTTPVTTLSQLTCPSAGTCYAVGYLTSSGTTVPETFTGTVNATATANDTWSDDNPPTTVGTETVAAVSQVTCATATQCVSMATGTQSTGAPAGFLLATSNGTTWTAVSLPSSDANVAYFDGVSCTSGASATCSAAGASPTGSVIVTSTGGPTGSWSDQTPTGLSGNAATGIPIEINNSGLLPSQYINAVTPGASPNVTLLPDLYPFSGGYGLWAGDCAAEASSYNVAKAATTPGGTSGITNGMSTPTVPLGLVAVKVLNASGVNTGLPHAGVILTLTVPTNANGCGTDTYTLQTSGADGLSRTLVPYGTYNLSAGGTAEGTVVVSGNATTLTTTSGVVTTVSLPNPVTVSA